MLSVGEAQRGKMREHIVANRVAAVAAAFALSTGLVLSAVSPATAAPSMQTDVGVLSVWQYNYYHNYFTSKPACDARGYAMIHYQQVPGMINWACHLNPGESQWSMDVLWTT
jgi:hypothetical protein